MKTKLQILLFFLIHTAFAQEPDFAWVKRFGTNSQLAYGPVAAVDSQGNSYVAGLFLSNSFNLDGVLFQPGTIQDAGINGYIAKYDSAGTLVWAKPTRGIINIFLTTSQPNTDKIIVDPVGNIYFTGEYESGKISSIDGYVLSGFDAENQSDKNFFLAKLSDDGNVTWVRTSTRSDNYFPYFALNDIHFDLEGNINMTGYFRESIAFSEDDILTHPISEGAIFLTKYNPQGEVVQSRKLEGGIAVPIDDILSCSEQLKPDLQGNLYRWSNNQQIKKLYKYNAQGDLLDSKVVDIYYNNNSTQAYPSLQGFAVDMLGNIIISGNFYGTLVLEGQPYAGYGNNSDSDAVIFKLSPVNFDVEWVHVPLLRYKDSFDKLLTDGLGNIYAAGQINSATENRMLLKKLNSNGALLWQKVVAGVQSPSQPLGGIHPLSISQAKDGGNLWVSGTFRRNAYFDATAHFITTSLSHYNGFLVQYGTCNTEIPQITTPELTQICSGETIELTANFSNPDLSYKWNTGQTTETITVDRAGIYYVIAQESDECYGKSQEIWITELAAPEVQVTFEGGSLSAIAENVTYQWINCEGQMPIEGETGAAFTPIQAGSYAVAVTSELGCTKISECRTVTDEGLSLDEYLVGKAFVIYPNPVKNTLYIKTIEEVSDITVTNILGQKMLSGTSTQVDVSAIPAGTYLLIARTKQGVLKGKFIKQ